MHDGEEGGGKKGDPGKPLTNFFRFLRHVHEGPLCFSLHILFNSLELNAIMHFIISVKMQVNAQNAIDLLCFLAVASAALKHLCGTQENDSIFSAAHGNMKVCHEIIIEVQSLPL